MTHEIKSLFETLKAWQDSGKKAVFVSVVALDGSSYRRPGVRMVICEDGRSAGAVSGGCVENEIERQAITAIRFLATIIIFLIDPSISSGISVSEQLHLLEDIQSTFPHIPYVLALNKIDLVTSEQIMISSTRLQPRRSKGPM